MMGYGIALLLLGAAAVTIYRRPQRGLLLLAALTPFNGLVAIIPGDHIPAWWKEALLCATVGAAVVSSLSPKRSRPAAFNVPWWPAIALLAVFGAGSALITLGALGWIPIKITFIYVAIVIAMWRAPLDSTDRDRLVTIIVAVAVVNSIVGIVQQFVGIPFLVDLGYTYGEQVRSAGPMLRSFGTFNQPFPYALFLMMAVLIGVSVALADPSRLRNKMILLSTPLLLGGIAVSVVRASYIGLALGLVCIGVLRYRKILVATLGTALVAILMLLVVAPQSTFAAVFSSNSMAERTQGWDVSFGMIASAPFGHGLGTAGAAADKITPGFGSMPPGLQTHLDAAYVEALGLPYQPDNYYIKMLLELGPVGLWLFVTFLVTAIASSVRISQRAQADVDAGLAVGIVAVLVATAAVSVVATYLEIFPMDVYTWLLLGTVGCIPLRSKVSTTSTTYASAPRLAPAGGGHS